MARLFAMLCLALCINGCGGPEGADAPLPPAPAPLATAAATASTPPLAAPAQATGAQRGQGAPYEIAGSQVWNVPDPVSGRDYQVFVALPRGYGDDPQRRYPVLYATDADYAFPLLRQISRRLNVEGPAIEDFILVGLSYAVGEDGMTSRRRDYTPTAKGPSTAPADAIHGQSSAYIAYLRDHVLPFMAGRFRTDESRRLFLGHSYGGLLGTELLLTEPGLFSGYILGSPSYWYDRRHMEQVEAATAAVRSDLAARVYMYVGQYEAIRAGDPRYASKVDLVADARRMEQRLLGRHDSSLQLRLEVLEDEDHLSVAPRGFTHGLRLLLPATADRAQPG